MFEFYKRRSLFKKRKNKIFLIILLILFVGVFGSIYSYSYLEHIITSKSNLKLKTGSISVNFDKEIKKNINIEGLKPGESKEDLIKIKNNGTLKTKIKLKFFKEHNNLDKEFLSSLEYKILVQNDYKKSKEFKGNLYDLLIMNEFLDIKDKYENYIILNPKEDLTLYFTLYLNKNINYKYYNKAFNFSLDIISSQINNSI